MQYIASIERLRIEQGLEQGLKMGMHNGELKMLQLLLQAKFGELPVDYKRQISQASNTHLTLLLES